MSITKISTITLTNYYGDRNSPEDNFPIAWRPYVQQFVWVKYGMDVDLDFLLEQKFWKTSYSIVIPKLRPRWQVLEIERQISLYNYSPRWHYIRIISCSEQSLSQSFSPTPSATSELNSGTCSQASTCFSTHYHFLTYSPTNFSTCSFTYSHSPTFSPTQSSIHFRLVFTLFALEGKLKCK